jgi:hypothetical protein
MARKLDAPPRGAPLWVQVTLLHAGVSSLVACGPRHTAYDPNHGPPPTCGPCCHGAPASECAAREEPPAPVPDAAVDAATDAK